MRAVAGSILVHAAVVLVAAVLLSSRLSAHPQTEEGFVNLVLVGGGFALGLFGLGVLVSGLGDRPRPAEPAAVRRLVREHQPSASPAAPADPRPPDDRPEP
jgi:hypothetical protein